MSTTFLVIQGRSDAKRTWKVEGNAAKLREALWWCQQRLMDVVFGNELGDYEPCCRKAVDMATAALATPPRNCDVYLTPEEMHRAWEDSGSRKAFSDWLLSEADDPNVIVFQ